MIIEIIFIIVLVLILLINMLFRSVVKTNQKKSNNANLSGFEIARKLSSIYCQEEPHIIKKTSKYLDYYDKERNTIKLSPEVFDGEDIYAGIMAVNVALETDSDRQSIFLKRKFNSFLVIASYLVIIIGAFTNNMLIIHMGMLLFILAFIIEFVLLSTFFKSEEELNKIYNLIKKENLIKPVEEYKANCLLLALSRLATLPYNFINYFK